MGRARVKLKGPYYYVVEHRGGRTYYKSYGRGPDAAARAQEAADGINRAKLVPGLPPARRDPLRRFPREDVAQIRTRRRCRICGATKWLVVDHCHVEQVLRGRLCGACNSGLGFFRDSPILLRRAADYLEKTTPRFRLAREARVREARATFHEICAQARASAKELGIAPPAWAQRAGHERPHTATPGESAG